MVQCVHVSTKTEHSYRLTYRHLLREEEKREKLSYINDLHDALLKKNGKLLWNCWRAKFEHSVPCTHVDGCADGSIVVNKFAEFLVTHIVIIRDPGPIYFVISIRVNAQRLRWRTSGISSHSLTLNWSV